MPIDKSKLTKVSNVYPLKVSPYEQYMGDFSNPSVVSKINSMVQTLLQMGRLTNQTVSQWNTVMEWIVNGGMDEIATTITTEKVEVALAEVMRMLDVSLNSGLKDLAIDVTDKKISELLASGQFESMISDSLVEINEVVEGKLEGFAGLLAETATNLISILQFKEMVIDGDDWSNAFQYAFDILKEDETLFIPWGKYKITKTLTRTKRLLMQGIGIGSVIVNRVPSGQPCIYINSGDAPWPYANYSELMNFKISGDNTTSGIGIKLNKSGYSLLENIHVFGCEHGIQFETNCWGSTLRQIFIKWSWKNGIDDSLHLNSDDANINVVMDRVTVEQAIIAINWNSADLMFTNFLIQNVTGVYIVSKGTNARFSKGYLECFGNYNDFMVKLQGYASSIEDVNFHGNGTAGKGIEYTTYINASRLVFGHLALGIKYSGVGVTRSSLKNIMNNGTVIMSELGSDNARISDDISPSFEKINTREGGIDTVQNPNGKFLPINGDVRPTTDQVYNLGSSTNSWLYTYANRGTFKWGVVFNPIDNTKVSLNQMFVDSADNKLKFKGNDNIIRTVTLT